MGTRHQQVVISKSGERKISQYGQWDGYPSGQGKDILEFLRGLAGFDEYQRRLECVTEMTSEQTEQVGKLNDKEFNEGGSYFHLTRDCGAKIHSMILCGLVESVHLISDEQARSWCEGFYTIDFKRGLFISEYYDKTGIWALNCLPTVEEYLEFMEPKEVVDEDANF